MTAAIDRRALGNTSMSVSALAMGCAKLGAFWQGRSPGMAREALAAARDQGIDLFDTADCYARGISERIIGSVFRHQRDQVVICTKVGLLKTPIAVASARRRDPRRGQGSSGGARGPAARVLREARGMVPGGEASACFQPAYVTKALERSLRRLQTDYVDLLLLHGPSVGVIQSGEFLPGLDEALRSGKARHVGISCTTAAEAIAALEVPGVKCVQVPHNLCRPGVVPVIVPRAAERGIAVMAIAPFGNGELLAERAGAAPSRDRMAGCLQFALNTPGVSAVVAGMSSPDHVTLNVSAATAGPVSEDAMARIREAACGDA